MNSQTARAEAASACHRVEVGRRLDVTIPAGGSAPIILSVLKHTSHVLTESAKAVLANGVAHESVPGIHNLRAEGQRIMLEGGSGSKLYSVRQSETLRFALNGLQKMARTNNAIRTASNPFYSPSLVSEWRHATEPHGAAASDSKQF